MSDSTARALRETLSATSMIGEDANVALALMRIAVALERLATAHERLADNGGDADVRPLRKAGEAA